MVSGLFRRVLGLPPVFDPRLAVPQIRKFDQFFAPFRAYAHELAQRDSLSVDLGCGSLPRNPFGCTETIGLDLRADSAKNIIHCDLAAGAIPLPDCFADVVTAYDLIEHIPRVRQGANGATFPFVTLMAEVHRLLKPGGYFFSKTPAYPFPEAFMDPTHVNIITEKTFPKYFCSPDPGIFPEAVRYGFNGSFGMLRQRWWGGAWLLTLMQRSH